MKRGWISVFLLCASVSLAATPKKAAPEGTDLPPEARAVLLETQGAQALAIDPVPVLDAGVPAAKDSEASPLSATAANDNLAASKAPENEIPLHLDKKKTEENGAGPLTRVVLGCIVLALMAGGAWFYLRKAARPTQRKNAPQIKVLNQHWLGPKKSLAIIRVAGESILIGVTDQSINLIKPLALMDEEVPETTPSRFEETFADLGLRGAEIEEDDDGEEFQMKGLHQIKDVVSRRLKGMRSLG